jgi:putative transposase
VRFRFVAAERAQHDVSRLCSMIGVSRQGFYAWLGRGSSARHLQDQRLKALIADAHEKSWRTYGVPRMHAELRDQGVRIAKKRVARFDARAGHRGRVSPAGP